MHAALLHCPSALQAECHITATFQMCADTRRKDPTQRERNYKRLHGEVELSDELTRQQLEQLS
jgi:hypothetical protein